MFTDLKIPAGRRPPTRSETLVSVGIGVAFTLMVGAAILDQFTLRKLSVLLFFFFWVPLLVLHELGHALMARAVGWRVREIVIGFGRTLWEGTLGETRIRIKLAPIEGYMLPAPVGRGRLRLKSALVYAAGPGVELLLLACVLGVFGVGALRTESEALSLIALKSFTVAVALGAGFNLLPFRAGAGVSDGLGILSAPFMSEHAVELRLVAVELAEAQRMLDSGKTSRALELIDELRARFSDNERLEQCRIMALAADGRIEEARERVRARLAQPGESEPARRDWLHLQAQVELHSESPAFLTLDLALQKALALAPKAPDLLATKGASLVLRGRGEEGGTLLASAWRSNDGSANDAEMLAYLAIAAAQVGRVEDGRRFGQAFKQINRSALLARRLESRLP